MSIRVIDAVFRSRYHRGGNHLLVLVAMADFADDDGANVRPSMDTLARKVRGSPRQVKRIVRDLERDGVIEVVANANGGAPGATRVYRLRLDRLLVPEHRQTGVIGDTGVVGDTGVIQGRDGCHTRSRRVSPVTPKPSLTVIEPKEVVAPTRDLARALSAPAPGELPCPIDEIVELYHECMPANPRVKVVSEARKRAIRARWKEAAALTCSPFGYETKDEGLAAWREFFATCAESAFLTGRAKPQPGRPPFLADIDFLMSPSGFAKCLENKYHREVA